jgi:cytochrome d ubiquinol oxidase subunit II
LILCGWVLAQFPFLVPPDIALNEAAAPETVLCLVLLASTGGVLILIPSLAYLFRIFKGETAFSQTE